MGEVLTEPRTRVNAFTPDFRFFQGALLLRQSDKAGINVSRQTGDMDMISVHLT